MQTKHLCVLIHILTKGEVTAPLNWFKYSMKYFTDRSKTVFFYGSFVFFFCLVCYAFVRASVYMSLVVTCWERADLLALVCGV